MGSGTPTRLRRVSRSTHPSTPPGDLVVADPTPAPGAVPEAGEDAEAIDALPVLADESPGRAHPRTSGSSGELEQEARAGVLGRVGGARLPAAPTIAAAGGHVVSATLLRLLHRRRRRRALLARRGRAGRSPRGARRGRRGQGTRGIDLLEIVASRSLLVDIHLLDAPGGDR